MDRTDISSIWSWRVGIYNTLGSAIREWGLQSKRVSRHLRVSRVGTQQVHSPEELVQSRISSGNNLKSEQ